jgi:hypothetical protein
MKNMSKITLITGVLVSLFLTGCSKNTVAMVKKGTLEDIDKTTTIGNAFGNYSYFSKSSWVAEEDAQKRKVVTFTGIYDVTKLANNELTPDKIAGLQKFKRFNQNNLAPDAEPEIPENEREAAQANVEKLKPTINDIMKFTFVAQFVLAADGNSFELGWHGLHCSQVENGQTVETDQEDTDGSEIAAIYQNQPSPVVIANIDVEAAGVIK